MESRARLVADSLANMKPGALGVGRKDIADGIPFLVKLAEQSGLPLVSSNIVLANGKYPFPRTRTLTWGGKKVAVMCLTFPMPERDRELGITVEGWEESAKKTLELVKDADIVVLLSDLGFDDEHELARKVKGIDIIIGGGSGQRLLTDPSRVGDTLILRASDRGRQLGALDVSSKSLAGGWKLPVSASQLKSLKDEIAKIDAQMYQAPGAVKNPPAEAERLKKARENLGQSLKALESSSSVSYFHKTVFLDDSVKSDPATEKAVVQLGPNPEAVRREAAMKQAQEFAKKNLPPPGAKPASGAPQAGRDSPKAEPPPDNVPFNTGTVLCRKCHQKQYDFWSRTPHFRSGNALYGQKAEGGCYSCHYARLVFSTGIAMEQVVGCESCHGRGSLHKGGKEGISRKVGEERCRGCHSGFHEKKDFDFAASYQKIRCDGGRR